MNVRELKDAIDRAPIGSRAQLEKLFYYVTIGDKFRPEYEDFARDADTYREFFGAIYDDPSQKTSLVWADWARLTRRNWLRFFEPELVVEKIRLKTDGLPIQFGSGVLMAPTGGRDNIANLYVFGQDAFNTNAADYSGSIGGKFSCVDYAFHGIYGLYRYRGSVILEAWQVEAPPVRVDGDTWDPS